MKPEEILKEVGQVLEQSSVLIELGACVAKDDATVNAHMQRVKEARILYKHYKSQNAAQDNPVTLLKLILEEFPIELHEGTFWIASLQVFPGVVVQAETRDKAIKELMISIEVKLCFDAGINTSPSSQDHRS